LHWKNYWVKGRAWKYHRKALTVNCISFWKQLKNYLIKNNTRIEVFFSSVVLFETFSIGNCFPSAVVDVNRS
jgi:hypothetical protein